MSDDADAAIAAAKLRKKAGKKRVGKKRRVMEAFEDGGGDVGGDDVVVRGSKGLVGGVGSSARGVATGASGEAEKEAGLGGASAGAGVVGVYAASEGGSKGASAAKEALVTVRDVDGAEAALEAQREKVGREKQRREAMGSGGAMDVGTALAEASFRKGDKRRGGIAPIRATSNIKSTTVMEYKLGICKDYFETGVCGRGDTCIFLHDRSRLKQSYQIDREWEEIAKKKEEEKQRLLAGEVEEKEDAAPKAKRRKRNRTLQPPVPLPTASGQSGSWVSAPIDPVTKPTEPEEAGSGE